MDIPAGLLIALNPQSCESWFLQTICTADGFWYLNLQANRVMSCLNLAPCCITLTPIRSCRMLQTHWTMYWETSFFHLWDRWSGMSQWLCSIILFTILFCFTWVSLLHPSVLTTSTVLSIVSSLSCLDRHLEDHVCSLSAYNLAFLYLYIYVCIRNSLAGATYHKFAITSMTLSRTSTSVWSHSILPIDLTNWVVPSFASPPSYHQYCAQMPKPKQSCYHHQ